MSVTLQVREETFDSLAEPWCALLREAPQANVFLSHAWHRIWWERFARDAGLKLLSFRLDGRLVAIAPLMLEGRTITFLGGTDLVDYHDFLLCGVEMDRFADALLGEVVRWDEWDTIELVSLPDWSGTLAGISAAAARRGWQALGQAEDVAPGLPLPDSWEGYLAQLGRKRRHELRRKMRRLEGAGDVRQQVWTAAEDITARFDLFASLHRRSTPGKAEFLTPDRAAFFYDVAVGLAGEDITRLYFLELDGKPVATSLCFEMAGTRFVYNSGFDPDYRSLSVGLLNHAMLVQRSIDEGIVFVDFLRGNERYKYDLGAGDRGLQRLTVHRP